MTDAADDATAAMANVSLEGVPTVEVIKPANTGMPPGRVRFAFKKLDADNSGGVDLDELKTGLAKEFGVDELAPHVIAAMEEKYNLHAEEKDGKKVLTAKVFGRYFCEVMFRHFDKDNSGTLELAEVQEALKFLVKPDADGNKVAPIIAFPPELTTESGEVHLPISWFWPCVHADSNPRPPPPPPARALRTHATARVVRLSTCCVCVCARPSAHPSGSSRRCPEDVRIRIFTWDALFTSRGTPAARDETGCVYCAACACRFIEPPTRRARPLQLQLITSSEPTVRAHIRRAPPSTAWHSSPRQTTLWR